MTLKSYIDSLLANKNHDNRLRIGDLHKNPSLKCMKIFDFLN